MDLAINANHSDTTSILPTDRLHLSTLQSSVGAAAPAVAWAAWYSLLLGATDHTPAAAAVGAQLASYPAPVQAGAPSFRGAVAAPAAPRRAALRAPHPCCSSAAA